MTIHCEPGDKPKITFTFNGKNKRIYQIDKSPIEVLLDKAPKRNSGNGEFNCYRVTFVDADNYRGDGKFIRSNGNHTSFWVVGKSVVWEVRLVTEGFYIRMYAYFLIVDGVHTTCGIRSISADTPSAVKDNGNPNCPALPTELECRIKVLHQGNLVFSAQGECPCDYTVACGGRCNPGEIECLKPGYPGYCCIPCQATAEKINNLANKIR